MHVPHLDKGQLACLATGLLAAWHSGAAPSLARSDYRYELLACSLDNLGLPLPWGICAALRSAGQGAVGTLSFVRVARWATEALAAGLYLPSVACTTLLTGSATSTREAADAAFECTAGVGFSLLAWSYSIPYRVYGGLNDALWLSWATIARASGYPHALCEPMMLARALRLIGLLAMPGADAEEYGYLLAVQIELLSAWALPLAGWTRILSASSPEAFQPGQRVQARFEGMLAWYPGTIFKAGADGMYTVAYDDGEVEGGVKWYMINPDIDPDTPKVGDVLEVLACDHTQRSKEFRWRVGRVVDRRTALARTLPSPSPTPTPTPITLTLTLTRTTRTHPHPPSPAHPHRTRSPSPAPAPAPHTLTLTRAGAIPHPHLHLHPHPHPHLRRRQLTQRRYSD